MFASAAAAQREADAILASAKHPSGGKLVGVQVRLGDKVSGRLSSLSEPTTFAYYRTAMEQISAMLIHRGARGHHLCRDCGRHQGRQRRRYCCREGESHRRFWTPPRLLLDGKQSLRRPGRASPLRRARHRPKHVWLVGGVPRQLAARACCRAASPLQPTMSTAARPTMTARQNWAFDRMSTTRAIGDCSTMTAQCIFGKIDRRVSGDWRRDPRCWRGHRPTAAASAAAAISTQATSTQAGGVVALRPAPAALLLPSHRRLMPRLLSAAVSELVAELQRSPQPGDVRHRSSALG